MRFHAILAVVALTVACFKTDIRKLCWEEFTKNKLCFPPYEKCLISGKEHGRCMDSFDICIQTGPIYKHSEFCNKQIFNLTIPQGRTSKEWIHNYLDETLNYMGSSNQSQRENHCDLHNLLFKTAKPKISNSLIERIPSLASIYCPCWENSDNFEAIRETKMKIPLQMWHGGFSSKKCWREFDRFLVEHLCGISSAMEINHIWAKSADCHENPNQESDCRKSFNSSLMKSANQSVLQIGCIQYYEIINAYLPLTQTPSFDYKITYVNTSELIYLQPYEYRNDRLYLMNSFEENAYFTCFTVKREVSSCNYMFEHCKNQEKTEKCGEKLIDCLSETSSECKKLLVQRNDNISTLEKIYHFVKNNKLQLAWPVILYIFWTLTKSIINWILLSISIKICLKISEILDRFSSFVESKTIKKTENDRKLVKIESNVTRITVESLNFDKIEPGFVEIPLENEVIQGNNDNNSNPIENSNEEKQKEEKEKEEEKKEKDYNFGQSFRKMLISFGRFVRSIYTFLEVFFKNIY